MIILVCALICALFLFADLITKTLAFTFEVAQTKYFIGLVQLNCKKNYGMMLGIGNSSPEWVMHLVTALTAVMIVGLVVLFFTVFKRNKPAQVCLAIIEAGAIGNFVDRVCLGYVRDFIDVNRFLFFPGYVCNVADICIMFGAIALVFIILFIGKSAVFPLTKKWREAAKIEDEQKAEAKRKKEQEREEKRSGKL